jgi:hypothetical protein
VTYATLKHFLDCGDIVVGGEFGIDRRTAKFIFEPGNAIFLGEGFHQIDDKRRFSGAEKTGENGYGNRSVGIGMTKETGDDGLSLLQKFFGKTFCWHAIYFRQARIVRVFLGIVSIGFFLGGFLKERMFHRRNEYEC